MKKEEGTGTVAGAGQIKKKRSSLNQPASQPNNGLENLKWKIKLRKKKNKSEKYEDFFF